jgi:hypothetical protein
MARAEQTDVELNEEGVASLLCSSRIQRFTGLGPIGLAVVAVLVTWLPLLVLSWVDHRDDTVESPVLRDVSVHVRCLVMIPVLIAGERVVAFILPWILVQIRMSGVLAAEDEPGYKALLLRAAKLRNSPWAFGILIFIILLPLLLVLLHLVEGRQLVTFPALGEVRERIRVGLAGQWYAFVVRPLIAVMMVVWLWRTWFITVYLCRGIARLPLRFAPTHPDGAGGIGFVADLPLMFTPFILAISSGAASDLAAAILAGKTKLEAMAFPIAGEAAVLVAFAVLPLLLFVRPLRDMAYDAYDDYSALLVRYGQRVDAKWIDGKAADDREDLLDAPELGPVADVNAMFQAVDNIQPLQISRDMLIKLAAVALVPFVPVVLMTLPLNDVIGFIKDIVL